MSALKILNKFRERERERERAKDREKEKSKEKERKERYITLLNEQQVYRKFVPSKSMTVVFVGPCLRLLRWCALSDAKKKQEEAMCYSFCHKYC